MPDYSFVDADHAAVASASRIVFSRYRQFVDYEDVQQELYLWLLSHYDRAQRWRAEYSEKHAERTLVKALRNAGERYCRREKAEQQGYSPEDEFFYSLSSIAALLQLSFDPEWMVPKGIDYSEPGQGGKTAGENLVAMVADVSSAYESLPEHDQKLLRWVYGGDREVTDAIAQKGLEWSCSQSAAYGRIRRVLGRLRAALGGENPWREVA